MYFGNSYISFIKVIRYALAIGGILWVGMGHLISLLEPEVWDPMYVRYLQMFLLVGLASIHHLPFRLFRDKHTFYKFSTGLYIGITLWSIILALVNLEVSYYALQAWLFAGMAPTLMLPVSRYWLFTSIMVAGLLLIGILPTSSINSADNYTAWIILMLISNGIILSFRSQSENRLRAMAHLSEKGPIPIFEVSPEGTIMFVNKRFCSLLGRNSQEVLGHSIYDLIEASDAKDIYQSGWLTDHIRTRELYFKRKGGELLPALVSLSPYDEDDEHNTSIIGTITDITELKEVEFQLKERNEQMDLFLYKATHDLKGPLASVKGILNIAAENSHQPEITQYIQMALTSTDKLDQALIDLLHVTRLNKADLIIEEVNCRELVEEILFSLQHMPESKDVQFEVEISYEDIFHSDKSALTTILQNLIVNAIKYKREDVYQHFVFIGIKRFKAGIKIEIKDNGEGIRNEIQDKVFTMFYRGNRRSKGTGLGLYIVKQGIEKLGGTLDLKSKPQKGTLFTLYIPPYRKKSMEKKEIIS